MLTGIRHIAVLVLGCLLVAVALAVLGFFIIPMSTRAPFYTVFAANTPATSTLWAWGSNDDGQLGDGTTVNKTVPIQIGSSTIWSAIAAGDMRTVGLKSDGTLWAWGITTKIPLRVQPYSSQTCWGSTAS